MRRRDAGPLLTIRHVDNPGDRVKFWRLDGAAACCREQARRKARENLDGTCRGTNVAPETASNRPCTEGFARNRLRATKAPHRGRLARGGAANAQAQRHPAGALRSRPRADDADQEYSRRPVLHDISDRARRRSGRHRLRRVDGRHARRGADADLRLCDAGKRAGLAGDPLSDSADHVRVRARHARRIQLRAVAGVPHHAAGARIRWRWSTTPRPGSTNSSSSSIDRSSRPSRRRRRWR